MADFHMEYILEPYRLFDQEKYYLQLLEQYYYMK